MSTVVWPHALSLKRLIVMQGWNPICENDQWMKNNYFAFLKELRYWHNISKALISVSLYKFELFDSHEQVSACFINVLLYVLLYILLNIPFLCSAVPDLKKKKSWNNPFFFSCRNHWFTNLVISSLKSLGNLSLVCNF